MKVCPYCGSVVSYNSYFGAYICPNCNWWKEKKQNVGVEKNKDQGEYSHTPAYSKSKLAKA